MAGWCGDMFGYLLGAVAVLWGVMLAVLGQHDAPGPNLERLCTALLAGGAMVVIAGGAAAALHG